ncbi:SIMPL domain-containing protein, partial [Paraclostridium sordellii]|uniref:SIMPL domain-containing protein n=1 Tax=Paraclostridium sordellii TaxID=1505 RepID=UPI0018CE1077
MRKIEINYQNTTSLVNDLITVTSELENEKESVKRALDELNDLENYHDNKGAIVNELEFRKRKIDKDIQNTEELIQNIKDFSERVQETDERLAQKFKQDIKSYAKQNSIELVSDFDKWLDKAQMALDAIGIFPLVGEVADVINGVIYLAKGDIKNAGISFISMIPEVGDTAKGIRYFDKASDILKYTDKAVDLEKSSKKLSKATKNLDIKDIDFKIDSKNINFKNNAKKEFNFSKADVNIQNKSNKISKRPSWRQSEIDVQAEFPDYKPQKSFIDGKEVPYGTKGSSRPDFYKKGTSIEVKNYKIT